MPGVVSELSSITIYLTDTWHRHSRRRDVIGKRSDVLELAVLGLLHEGPRHGYELRKDLNCRLGLPYPVSFGTLYPTLRCLLSRGLTRQLDPEPPPAGRARVTYALTTQGRSRFQALTCRPGPDAWEDGAFDVHFAFFARIEAAARLHVLEGRRVRMQERSERVRRSLAAGSDPPDRYRRELQRHGLECVERELGWLSRQIELERDGRPAGPDLVHHHEEQ